MPFTAARETGGERRDLDHGWLGDYERGGLSDIGPPVDPTLDPNAPGAEGRRRGKGGEREEPISGTDAPSACCRVVRRNYRNYTEKGSCWDVTSIVFTRLTGVGR